MRSKVCLSFAVACLHAFAGVSNRLGDTNAWDRDRWHRWHGHEQALRFVMTALHSCDGNGVGVWLWIWVGVMGCCFLYDSRQWRDRLIRWLGFLLACSTYTLNHSAVQLSISVFPQSELVEWVQVRFAQLIFASDGCGKAYHTHDTTSAHTMTEQQSFPTIIQCFYELCKSSAH
jgi:hypothetical protein